MASNALSAFGTLLKLGDGGSPESFTTVAELRTISGPSLSADALDATTHNTPTPFRRFIAGLLDGGEVSFDLNWIPQETTHSYSTGVLKDMLNRTRRNIQLVFPDVGLTTWTLPIIFTAFEMSSDPADILQASVTAKVSGPPTFA
jgi:hypothetical protein